MPTSASRCRSSASRTSSATCCRIGARKTERRPGAGPAGGAGGRGADLYIDQQKFPAQFAADIHHAKAVLMAAGQRPVTDAALKEASGEPAWKTIPSWSICGKQDRNIPPAALAFMAERAKSRHTVTVDGASHVVMVSHPAEVAKLIEEAATAK